MIYLLKFGASLLLPPGLFIIILFVVSCILWRKQEYRLATVLSAVAMIFYLLSTSWLSGMLINSLENKYSRLEISSGDCIIVLGGGAMAGNPSMAGEGTLSCAAGSRMVLAAQIYHQRPLPIILSGGQVYADSGNEAEIARRELQALGIPEQDIIVEDQSINTRQNAIFTCKILTDRGFKRPILVTSAFHMERSVLNFQKEGFEVIPFPADFRTGQPQRFHWNKLEPSALALENSMIFFREKLRSFVTLYIE